MMAFPGMIAQAAREAGMSVPPDPDEMNWTYEEYPYFTVFCIFQLGRSVCWGNHWFNAKIIAEIPREQLDTIGESELRALGFQP